MSFCARLVVAFSRLISLPTPRRNCTNKHMYALLLYKSMIILPSIFKKKKLFRWISTINNVSRITSYRYRKTIHRRLLFLYLWFSSPLSTYEIISTLTYLGFFSICKIDMPKDCFTCVKVSVTHVCSEAHVYIICVRFQNHLPTEFY